MSYFSSDKKLVAAYLGGKCEAAEEISHYIASAFSSWRRKLSGIEEDISSDVHLKLLQILQGNRFAYEASLKTFVSRIVSHTCIDYLRYQDKFADVAPEDLALPDTGLNPQELLEFRQTARLSFRVLRLVPKECLQLWRMHLKQGLTCGEIGKTVGKSEGNIRRRLWACRESAKEIREKILLKDKRLGQRCACSDDERKVR
jgi:RNA polymerase sigma factor (sigma-70 family)